MVTVKLMLVPHETTTWKGFLKTSSIRSQHMQAILLSREEVAQRAKQLYESSIRQQVEVEENIGKMVIIDIETGDYLGRWAASFTGCGSS
jgi:ABC-type enterochelin transport system substrate-binding protein